MVIKKEKLHTFNLTSILIQYVIDKFITQKWHIVTVQNTYLENPAVNLNSLCNSCAKVACCSSLVDRYVFIAAAASKMQASNSSHAATFRNPTTHKKYLT